MQKRSFSRKNGNNRRIFPLPLKQNQQLCCILIPIYFKMLARSFLTISKSSVFAKTSVPAVQAAFFSRMTGKVQWFDPKKGFGFIIPDGSAENIFVHQTQIKTEGFRSLAGEILPFLV
jgi:hypothetical protein